jgi:hypothetical protein
MSSTIGDRSLRPTCAEGTGSVATGGDGGFSQIAAETAKARKGLVPLDAGQTAEADDSR